MACHGLLLRLVERLLRGLLAGEDAVDRVLQAAWNSALAGEAGMPNENRWTSRTFLTAWSKNGLIDVYVWS